MNHGKKDDRKKQAILAALASHQDREIRDLAERLGRLRDWDAEDLREVIAARLAALKATGGT